MYREAVSLKERERRNLRDAFQKFEEDSGCSNTEATKELEECYLHRRGCERDLIKIAALFISKLKLKNGDEMGKEGKVSECMKLYWTASDLGEEGATTRSEAI